jgi:hypothetical protein
MERRQAHRRVHCQHHAFKRRGFPNASSGFALSPGARLRAPFIQRHECPSRAAVAALEALRSAGGLRVRGVRTSSRASPRRGGSVTWLRSKGRRGTAGNRLRDGRGPLRDRLTPNQPRSVADPRRMFEARMSRFDAYSWRREPTRGTASCYTSTTSTATSKDQRYEKEVMTEP